MRDTAEANLRITFLPLVYRVCHLLPLNLFSLSPIPFITCFTYFPQLLYLMSAGGIYPLQTEDLYTFWTLYSKHSAWHTSPPLVSWLLLFSLFQLNDISIASFFDLLNYIQCTQFSRLIPFLLIPAFGSSPDC